MRSWQKEKAQYKHYLRVHPPQHGWMVPAACSPLDQRTPKTVHPDRTDHSSLWKRNEKDQSLSQIPLPAQPANPMTLTIRCACTTWTRATWCRCFFWFLKGRAWVERSSAEGACSSPSGVRNLAHRGTHFLKHCLVPLFHSPSPCATQTNGSRRQNWWCVLKAPFYTCGHSACDVMDCHQPINWWVCHTASDTGHADAVPSNFLNRCSIQVPLWKETLHSFIKLFPEKLYILS